MRRSLSLLLLVLPLLSLGLACSDDSSPGTGGAATSSAVTGATVVGSSGSSVASASASNSGSSSSTGNASSSSAGGAGGGVVDPDGDGPYTFEEHDGSTTDTPDGSALAIHYAVPTGGPSAAPYPTVVVAHGFQLPIAQYEGYLKRLASFGYVVLLPDYTMDLFSPDHVKGAHQLMAALDFASTELGGTADTENAGMTGHSLGGKLSLLAATLDPRVKASITLDPVDGGMGCMAPACPDVSALVSSLTIPTAFLGETIDGAPGPFGQACAPTADNYATFYANAPSPSLSVTVVGAHHMSFLDNEATCGFACSFCNAATASNADVHALALSYVTAFYERRLRGIGDYDAYLTGAEAQTRYVTSGRATLDSH